MQLDDDTEIVHSKIPERALRDVCNVIEARSKDILK